MLRRAKRAAIFASPLVAVGAWAGLVLEERRKDPPDVRFSIGSAGMILLPSIRHFGTLPYAYIYAYCGLYTQQHPLAADIAPTSTRVITELGVSVLMLYAFRIHTDTQGWAWGRAIACFSLW